MKQGNLSHSIRAGTRTPEPRKRPARPPMTGGSIPPGVRGFLEGVQRRHLLLPILKAILWIVILFTVSWSIRAALDWMLNFSRPIRATFLILEFLAAGFIIHRWIWLPWMRKLSFERAALLTQDASGGWRSGLITLVQLSSSVPKGTLPAKFVLNKLSALATKRFSDLNTSDIVPFKSLRPSAITALLVLIISVGLGIVTLPGSMLLLKRIALLNQPLPTRTMIANQSGDLKLIMGEKAEMTALASGVIPKSARLIVDFPDGTRKVEELPSIPAQPGRFRHIASNVQVPFRYYFEAGDGTSESHQVTVRQPPALLTVGFQGEHPTYMGLPKETIKPGDLRVYTGSTLTISGQADRPIRSARILFPESETQKELGTNGDSFTGEWTIDGPLPDRFSIEVVDFEDVASINPVVYRLRHIEDELPVIELAGSWPRDSSVIPESRLPLKMTVNDDFGLSDIHLVLQKQGDESAPIRIPLIDQRQPDGTINFLWTPGESFGEGDVLDFWIEAADNRPSPNGDNLTKTSPQRLAVVSKQEKEAELRLRAEQAMENVRVLSEDQDKLREEVGRLLPGGQ